MGFFDEPKDPQFPTILGGPRSIALGPGQAAASQSLARDGETFVPRQGRPNTYLLDVDGKRGDNLRKISTTQLLVTEQKAYEQEIIFGKLLHATLGVTEVKFLITPLPDECIEIFHAVILLGATSLFFNIFKTTQKDRGSANATAQYGQQSLNGGFSNIVLSQQGTPFRLNTIDSTRNLPGPIMICGADVKPNGIEVPDLLNFNSTTIPPAAQNITLTYFARRVPPPAAMLNGDTRVKASS